MEHIDTQYLSSTAIIDSDNKITISYAMDIVGKAQEPIEQAVKLYYAVRDDIWYNPYLPFHLPQHYRASNTIQQKCGFCISKSVVLCATARVCGIPSRIGFATVRNHLASKKFIAIIGGNLFLYHAFTEFYLGGKWIKATPTFNIELCHKHRIPPLEFNGREDSIFHAYTCNSTKFMEYVAYHGSYADVPLAEILAAWEKTYGKGYMARWQKGADVSVEDTFYR